ncbi:MAG: 6,7-dimethyl-8-ribityllumazine synthase, partial [Verrucomicrobiota bacterium]
MSKSAPDPLAVSDAAASIEIVASRYNSKYTDALVQSASETIQRLRPQANIRVTRVPGAYEIPVVVEKLASSDNAPDAVVALGVIIPDNDSAPPTPSTEAPP